MRTLVLGMAMASWPFITAAQTTPATEKVPVRPPARALAAVVVSAPAAAADRALPVKDSLVPAKDSATQGPLAVGDPESTPAPPSTLPRFETDLRPPARPAQIPRTRWQHKQGHALWTRTALSALKQHGRPLVELVPRDIANWCPAYPTASDAQRRAFWVGFMSALAKHESTYKATAVGGGGKWYGLLQILPGTARGYKCNVRTGEALKNGGANLSCAIRIMAHTVPRDGVIHGYRGKKGQGVTADWGPMHKASKRRDMAGWLRQQTYCKPIAATRPRVRP